MYTVKFTNLLANVSSYSIHYKYEAAWDGIRRYRLDMEFAGWVEGEEYTIEAPVEMTWDETGKLYVSDLLDEGAIVLYEAHVTESED